MMGGVVSNGLGLVSGLKIRKVGLFYGRLGLNSREVHGGVSRRDRGGDHAKVAEGFRAKIAEGFHAEIVEEVRVKFAKGFHAEIAEGFTQRLQSVFMQRKTDLSYPARYAKRNVESFVAHSLRALRETRSSEWLCALCVKKMPALLRSIC